MLVATLAITFTVSQADAKAPSPSTGTSFGAVKADLYERMPGDPPNGAGSGELSGFAILNVDPCTELLLANVHLKEGDPESNYDVYVKINGAVNMVGNLMTNPAGKGAAQFYLDVSEFAGPEGPGEIDLQVVVKPEGSAEIDGFASATVTESFPDCDGE